MILPIGLKRVCDISFYMTFATTIAWMFADGNEPGLIIALPIFMVSVFLAAFLAIKQGNLRFLAILPMLSVFLLIPLTTVNTLVLVPAVALMVIKLPKPDDRGSKVEYQKQFQMFIRLFIVAISFFILITIIEMTSGGWSRNVEQIWISFSNEVLIFGLTFLASSIIYMRMVRHDVDILKQRRFKLMNTMPLVVLAIAALVVSHPWTLQVGSTILLGPIYLLWRGISWVFPHFGYLLAIPFRGIELERPPAIHGSPTGNPDDHYDFGCYPGMECDASFTQYNAFNPLALIFGIAAVIGAIMLYRMLLKNKVVDIDPEEEERSYLVDTKKPKFWKRNENQIRAVYEKFLRLLKQKKIKIPESATSLDVEMLAVSGANQADLSALRAEYVRVRYGESEYSKADVTRVQGLYKKIKAEFEILDGDTR